MTQEQLPAGAFELRDYVALLKRQWLLITVIALLGLGAAAAWDARQTPMYRSTAQILVKPITVNAFEPGVRPDQLLNMNNQKELVVSQPVALGAARALKLKTTDIPSLLEGVSADVPANSQILAITFSDPSPVRAQQRANAFASSYLGFRKADAQKTADASKVSIQSRLIKLGADVQRQDAVLADPKATDTEKQNASAAKSVLNGQIQTLRGQYAQLESLDINPGDVIQSATLPASPSTPRHAVDLGLGLFLGLFVGVALAVVRDRTQDRIRGREDLAALLDRPVLALLPKLRRLYRKPGTRLGVRRRHRSQLVTLSEPDGPAAEAYRTLRTRVAVLAGQLDVKTIMVVSPGVNEGKSTTAANLAVALAESGRDVLLVSADLRRPRVHEFFGLSNRSGLSNLLADALHPEHEQADDRAAVESRRVSLELWSVAENLWVIASGPLPQHPSALLDSDAMRQFLKEQRDLFDFIVMDCPPALVVSDSLALASLADAVLVVADAKSTKRAAIMQLADQLDQVGGKVVGSIINRSAKVSAGSYYYAASKARPEQA